MLFLGREHTARVMETVRAINTKRNRKTGASKSKNTSTPEGAGFNFTYSPTVTESKGSAEGASTSQAGNPVAGEYIIVMNGARTGQIRVKRTDL